MLGFVYSKTKVSPSAFQSLHTHLLLPCLGPVRAQLWDPEGPLLLTSVLSVAQDTNASSCCLWSFVGERLNADEAQGFAFTNDAAAHEGLSRLAGTSVGSGGIFEAQLLNHFSFCFSVMLS